MLAESGDLIGNVYSWLGCSGMDVINTVSTKLRFIDAAIDRALALAGMGARGASGGEMEHASVTVVRRYTALAFAGGLIPFSYLDLVAVSSAQLAMVAEISRIYGVPFERERVRAIASSLLGSVVPQGLAAGVAGSAIKSLPVVGQLAGMALMPAFSASFTYALGKVFIRHFEAGGTLLDLDPAALKAHFVAQFEAHARDRGAAVPPDEAACAAAATETNAPEGTAAQGTETAPDSAAAAAPQRGSSPPHG